MNPRVDERADPAGPSVSRRIRSAVRDVRWALARTLSPRQTVRARGVTFTLPCDNPITHFRARSLADKEPETLDWIDRHVRDGDVLLDVGANIGIYSLYAARRHPRLTVTAIEPEYSNLHYLRDNVLANSLGTRIEVYSCAFSDRSGLSRLHIGDLRPGAALHTDGRESLDRTAAGQLVLWSEGIWALTMDDFCAQRGLAPNAVKIDVDGGEGRVLSGATAVMKSEALRTVLIEVDTPYADTCRRLLTSAGLKRLASPREAIQVWVRDR